MPKERTDRLVAIALTLEVHTDASDTGALEKSLILARKHDIYLYDALYLELAIRKSAALATLDSKLIAAARAENVQVL
ncbi:MAG: type II toxin-antitoxin system VapC family toxin [Puniceicoccales bacterium]|jgi:predicted nucleic acid-binding protein|nr:type II toxin-antitoxin system VapC family toxin [Puniceicoccales bacterium]